MPTLSAWAGSPGEPAACQTAKVCGLITSFSCLAPHVPKVLFRWQSNSLRRSWFCRSGCRALIRGGMQGRQTDRPECPKPASTAPSSPPAIFSFGKPHRPAPSADMRWPCRHALSSGSGFPEFSTPASRSPRGLKPPGGVLSPGMSAGARPVDWLALRRSESGGGIPCSRRAKRRGPGWHGSKVSVRGRLSDRPAKI